MPIKGKQIIDNSIPQEKLNIETDSIIYDTDITNKEYVDTTVDEHVKNIRYNKLNRNMQALNAGIGDKACNIAIIEFPKTNVRVIVNGADVNVGPNLDCYFSPDNGITKREQGEEQKGDFLFWNSNKYMLDSSDEIDFIYLVSYVYIMKEENSYVALVSPFNDLVVEYTGASGTSMTVNLENTNILVGNVNGNFVWDIGGSNEHTFTYIDESYVITINGEDYTIWYDGPGSLIYSIKKGTYSNKFYIGTGFNDAVRGFILYSDGSILVVGKFTKYKNISVNHIVKIKYSGEIDETFNIGSGFNNHVYGIIELPSAKLVLTGNFTSYNGTTYNRIIILNPDGTIDSTFNIGSGFNSNTNLSLYTINNKLLISGTYTTFNGTSANNIVMLNLDGSIYTGFNYGTGFNNTTNGIAQLSNGDLIISGKYTSYNGTNAGQIVKLNLQGILNSAFNSNIGNGTNNKAYGVSVYNDDLYIVGDFSSFNSHNANDIVKIDSNGNIDLQFMANCTGSNHYNITTSFQSDGKIIVVGEFSRMNGVYANRIARLNVDGTFDTNFNINGSGFDNAVYPVLVLKSDDIIVGGYFHHYNNIVVNGFVKLDKAGNILTIGS